jgi:hypothetical protein
LKAELSIQGVSEQAVISRGLRCVSGVFTAFLRHGTEQDALGRAWAYRC